MLPPTKAPVVRCALVISSLTLLTFTTIACSGSDDTTPTDATTGTTIEIAGPPAALAGSCPTQQALDTAQGHLEAASGEASSVDDLTAEYDASFAFLAAYLPAERLLDLGEVRSAFSGYLQALEGIDLADLDQLSEQQAAALDEASRAFITPEVEQANARIQEYFAQACPDVDFGGGTEDTTPG
jgi:hypothetical protein